LGAAFFTAFLGAAFLTAFWGAAFFGAAFLAAFFTGLAAFFAGFFLVAILVYLEHSCVPLCGSSHLISLDQRTRIIIRGSL
jgi:predicted phage tail protein